ncbi:hypothetical protein MHUMG1_08108 [Metarhizium humberi]|uniref:Uncharacterized protein n=1 Tax=Metarhizium humberi TaxID=2596975 RepID=A0A9P8S4K2_9HYPO|nr:hypothetical protein MHUMG1_08108 [Metarhizium humberi]
MRKFRLRQALALATRLQRTPPLGQPPACVIPWHLGSWMYSVRSRWIEDARPRWRSTVAPTHLQIDTSPLTLQRRLARHRLINDTKPPMGRGLQGLLSWDQGLSSLESPPVSFGAWGHRHLPLPTRLDSTRRALLVLPMVNLSTRQLLEPPFPLSLLLSGEVWGFNRSLALVRQVPCLFQVKPHKPRARCAEFAFAFSLHQQERTTPLSEPAYGLLRLSTPETPVLDQTLVPVFDPCPLTDFLVHLRAQSHGSNPPKVSNRALSENHLGLNTPAASLQLGSVIF